MVEGGRYGLAGRGLDTRVYAVLVGEPDPKARAEAELARAGREFPGGRAALRPQLVARAARSGRS